MTAGKGIVHAEMPSSWDEDSIGFQLWINLSKEKKLVEPKYQEFKKGEIPNFFDDGINVTVISGEYKGVVGKITPESKTYFYDVKIEKNKSVEFDVNSRWNGLIYPYKGMKLEVNNKILKENEVVIFEGNGVDKLKIVNFGEGESGFIVVMGEPLNQPVAKYGPFVMSSRDELRQAFDDFREGKNGFEDNRGWESEISKLSYSEEL